MNFREVDWGDVECKMKIVLEQEGFYCIWRTGIEFERIRKIAVLYLLASVTIIYKSTKKTANEQLEY
jgi:hypothetical protein